RSAIAADASDVNLPAIMQSLNQYNVKQMPEHKIAQIEENGVMTYNKEDEEVFVEGDIIVNALGMTPNSELAETFQDTHRRVRSIGDCSGIGKAGDAIRNGYFAGYSID